jgi:two-component system sensor histidine kinase KdpD
MTRLESGAVAIKREWVPLEEVVGSALTRLETELATRAVHADLPGDLPLVAADPVLLEQAFVNLLENNIKYTPPASPIEISASAQAGVMTVEIADRGPGVPVNERARVFDRFTRGRHAGVPGAGLGLAICRSIAAAHGGTLTLAARPGGGALFRLELPLPEPPPALPGDGEVDLPEKRRAS